MPGGLCPPGVPPGRLLRHPLGRMGHLLPENALGLRLALGRKIESPRLGCWADWWLALIQIERMVLLRLFLYPLPRFLPGSPVCLLHR